MSDITTEIAESLNGASYPLYIPKDINEKAKSNGVVIVYGASDDLMEFDGAIYDELGCYDGGTAFVDSKGLLPCRESIEDDEELRDYFNRKDTAKAIEALWCVDKDYSWQYKTDIPHKTFDVVEDDGKYCKGIVFLLSDVC